MWNTPEMKWNKTKIIERASEIEINGNEDEYA